MTAAGSQTPHTELEKRRKNALKVARAVTPFGVFIVAGFALLDMVSKLRTLRLGLDVCNDGSMHSLKLVEVLTCRPDLGGPWHVTAIEIGIVVEILLILFFSARMYSGKGFISAVLLFILFGVEAWFRIEGSTGPDKMQAYVGSGAMAGLLGIGVWATWQYRRLSRKIAAADGLG